MPISQHTASSTPSSRCTSTASHRVSFRRLRKFGAAVGFLMSSRSMCSNSLSKVPKTHFPSSASRAGVGALLRSGAINLL